MYMYINKYIGVPTYIGSAHICTHIHRGAHIYEGVRDADGCGKRWEGGKKREERVLRGSGARRKLRDKP